jgi:dTDP-4-dehydrorhamnose reductase
VKIAVTGSHGQVGYELLRQGIQRRIDMVGWSRSDLDITDRDAVMALMKKVGPDLLINAAAFTAVDRAESEPAKAYAVNRDGVVNLAVACREAGVPLIHISTDYVFDGRQSGPYAESDPVHPTGVYGASKLAGEKALEREYDQHLIIRTSWVYGVHGHNFVKTMLRLGREREEVRVVADQYGCPTSATDLAAAILDMAGKISSGNRGLYHYCARGAASWYEFALAIFEEARRYDTLRVCRVLPIATSDYPTPARRPANSVLDCHKVEETFHVARHPWRQGLHRVIKELYT